jgi:hypothetical protein
MKDTKTLMESISAMGIDAYKFMGMGQLSFLRRITHFDFTNRDSAHFPVSIQPNPMESLAGDRLLNMADVFAVDQFELRTEPVIEDLHHFASIKICMNNLYVADLPFYSDRGRILAETRMYWILLSGTSNIRFEITLGRTISTLGIKTIELLVTGQRFSDMLIPQEATK